MAYLCSINYTLGAPVPIGELNDSGVTAELDNLRREGLTTARVSSRSAPSLGAIAGRATIEAVTPSKPGALLYATETTAGVKPAADLWDLAQEIGVPELPAMTISGNACGNLAPALSVAADMAGADRSAAALVVTADVEHEGSRYQPFGNTVTSDGAAACYVTAAPSPDSFRILGVATRTQADLVPAARSVAGARSIARALQGALADLRSRTPEAAHFDTFLTGNYGQTTRSFLAGCLGMRDLEFRSVESIGHCSAADLLIALAQWRQARPRVGGEKILLLGTSSRTWSLIALRYVADPSADR